MNQSTFADASINNDDTVMDVMDRDYGPKDNDNVVDDDLGSAWER